MRWLLRSAHRACWRSQGSRVARPETSSPHFGQRETTRVRASPGCGTAGQWCSARVVGDAEAGSLASERPLLFGRRETRQGADVAAVQHTKSVVLVTGDRCYRNPLAGKTDWHYTLISKRHTRGWASQGSSTAEQSCAARVVVGVEAGSLKAEDHPTLVSKRHTLALSSHQHSIPNQSCPARKPVHFGKRVTHLGSES